MKVSARIGHAALAENAPQNLLRAVDLLSLKAGFLFVLWASVACFSPRNVSAQSTLRLKGQVNHLHDISLELDFRGDSCFGKAELLRSKTSFRLSGTRRGDSLFLQEFYGDLPQVTGRVQGVFKEDSSRTLFFTGHWFDAQNHSGSLWQLSTFGKEPVGLSYCGQSHWARRYQGLYHGYLVEVVAQRNGPDPNVVGFIYYDESRRTFPLSGEEIESAPGQFNFLIETPDGGPMGAFKGRLGADKAIECTFTDANGRDERVVLYPRESLDVGCMEFADFFASFDISYPQVQNNNGFNTVVMQMVDSRVRYYQAQFAETTPSLEKRAVHRAYSWWQLYFMNERVISGLISFASTKESSPTSFDYCYDLKTNRSIELDDIFYVSGTNFQKDIKQLVLKELEKRPYAGEEAFKTWLAGESFRFFTIHQEGILFHSEFHPLFGRQSAMVPYQVLRLYLRPNTLLSELAHQ